MFIADDYRLTFGSESKRESARSACFSPQNYLFFDLILAKACPDSLSTHARFSSGLVTPRLLLAEDHARQFQLMAPVLTFWCCVKTQGRNSKRYVDCCRSARFRFRFESVVDFSYHGLEEKGMSLPRVLSCISCVFPCQ